MKVYLKDIPKNKILESRNLHYQNKQNIEKAINKLISDKLFVNISNMGIYDKNGVVSIFSYEKDMKREKAIYEEETDKIQFLVDWYFIYSINNLCHIFENREKTVDKKIKV